MDSLKPEYFGFLVILVFTNETFSPITLKSSIPTHATAPTVPTFPKKRTKSPTQFMATIRKALETIMLKARLADLQKL